MDGKPLGEEQVQANLTAVFVVPFAPGKLDALCINGTAVVAGISARLATAKTPAALRLTTDRSTLNLGDPNDLSYVTIEVVDSNGVAHPTAAVAVSLSMSAGGNAAEDAAGVVTLEAVGSGDPSDPSSFTASNRTTWHVGTRAIPTTSPRDVSHSFVIMKLG